MSAHPIYKVAMDNQGNGSFVNIHGRWDSTSNDVIFDETSTLFNPKLSVEVNEPGSFEFTMPSTHHAINYPTLYATTVEVFEYDGDVYRSIFYGRVISITTDFYNQKTVRCEGCLAFFRDHVIAKDSIQAETGNKNIYTPGEFLTKVVQDYNAHSQNGYARKFRNDVATYGSGTVLGKTVYRTVEYENCWDVIEQKVLSAEGGYLIVTRSSVGSDFEPAIDQDANARLTSLTWVCADLDKNEPYPPYRYDSEDASTYTNIAYGNNLMSLSFEQEIEDLHTSIMPIYKYENDNGKTKYVTIKGASAADGDGSGESYKLNLNYSNTVTADTTIDIFGKGTNGAAMRRVCPATVTVNVSITGTWTATLLQKNYDGSTKSTETRTSSGNFANIQNYNLDLESAKLTLVHDSEDTTSNPKVVVTCTYGDIGVSSYSADYYLWNFEAVRKYGFMSEIVEISSSGYEELSEVKSSTKRKKLLLKEAVNYLERQDVKAESIEVKGAELAYLKPTLTRFQLGTAAHIVSSEHNLDTVLTITKIEYSLDSALKSVTLGTPQMVSLTEYFRKKGKEYTKDYSVGGYEG